MADLQDLLIRIDATTEQLRKELKRAETSVDQTAGKIDKSLGRVDSKFDALAKTVAKTGAAMAAAALAAGGVKLIQVARQTDVLDAQLKTATGSAEAASKAFTMLEGIASQTPYSLDQVVTAFVRLKNLGLDPSREAIMSYGNTAAAMGKSLDQMIEAVADASTAEFERLKEFGIRAKNQGDTVAFTFRGITETIGNNAAEIEGYLRRIGDVQFAGAMEDRANSLDGALSNLGDAWDGLFRTIARGPVGDAIETQVRAGIAALDALARKVAILQGTSTPEQDLQERMSQLESQRGQLVSEISKAPQGSNYFNALSDQLEDVQNRIAYVYERLQMLKSASAASVDRPRGSIEEIRVTAKRKKGPKKKAYTDGGLFDRNMDDEADMLGAWSDAASEVQGLFDATRTETEQIQAQIARVKELAAQGFFSDAGIDDQQVLERLNAQLADIEKKTDTLTEFGVQAARSIQQAFSDFLFDPFQDGLDGMLDGFLETIRRMVAEVAASEILKGIFGGMKDSDNSFFASLGAAFGGGRAIGGPVLPGKAYMVGERGPEMFHPTVGGRISPISGTSVQIIDQRGSSAPPVDVSEQMVNGQQMIRVMVRGEIGAAFADGSIDRLFAASSMPIRRTGRR